MKHKVRTFGFTITFAAALAAAGCATHVTRPETAAEPTPPFEPTSAANALRLFEWAYNNRAIGSLDDLFSGDFEFVFNPADSAGAPFRSRPWTRADEMNSTQHLFAGGGPVPPANTISLTFDYNLVVQPDDVLAPWDVEGRWHKMIDTQVLLNIRTTDGNAIDVSGAAVFYFVRGDSAAITLEEISRGFGADSTRWYIRRWDDETMGLTAARVGPFDAQPSKAPTWGLVKAVYLDPGPTTHNGNPPAH